eukprot:TRINITY_DN17989_c0_g1_i1.p1 TRINITY_DN17989_c0_g1~~TRINITY_DN17989_c0_g1_i1.p1  ORF type:complete len:919 (+),score=138.88 TRINITY_DN17989_c0_g1_i1:93-2849(+)
MSTHSDSDVSSESGSESTASGAQSARKNGRSQKIERYGRVVDVREGGSRVTIRQFLELREDEKKEKLKKIVKREGTKKVFEVTTEVLGIVTDHDETPEHRKFVKTVVRRSMKQFERLSMKISREFPAVPVPALQRARRNIKTLPNNRQNLPPLVSFLHILLTHPTTCKSEILWDFLTLPSHVLSMLLKVPKNIPSIRGLPKAADAHLSDLKRAGSSAKRMLSSSLRSLGVSLKQPDIPRDEQIRQAEVAQALHNQKKQINDQVVNSTATSKSACVQGKMLRKTIESSASLRDSRRNVAWALHGCAGGITDLCYKASSVYYEKFISSDPSPSKTPPPTDNLEKRSLCVHAEGYAGSTKPDWLHTTYPYNTTLEDRWLYTVITPAPVHRIRKLPSRVSDIVAEVTPGTVLLLDMTQSLQNGEEWGYTTASGGWTLLNDPGMEHVTPSSALDNIQTPTSPPEYITGDVIHVQGPSGKRKDSIVLDVAAGMLHIAYLGCDPKDNEWIPCHSERLSPCPKPGKPYALLNPSKLTSGCYHSVAHLYHNTCHDDLYELTLAGQLASGLVDAAARLATVNGKNLQTAEKTEKDFVVNTEASVGKDPSQDLAGLVRDSQEATHAVWSEHEATRTAVRNTLGKYAKRHVALQHEKAVREAELWGGLLAQLDGGTSDDLTGSFNDVLKSATPKPITEDDVLGRPEMAEIADLITPLTAQCQAFAAFTNPSHDDGLDIFGDAIPEEQRTPAVNTKPVVMVPPIPTLTPSKDLFREIGPLSAVSQGESEVSSHDPSLRDAEYNEEQDRKDITEGEEEGVKQLKKAHEVVEKARRRKDKEHRLRKEQEAREVEAREKRRKQRDELQERAAQKDEDETPLPTPTPKQTSKDMFQLHLNKMKPLEVDETLVEAERKKLSARGSVKLAGAAWDDL